MLGDNLKRIRKERGFTQEELAVRLHVVRQTVSKWEKNLSVPDAELLQRLSETLDVPVSELLGGESDRERAQERQAIAEQLARINEQLALKNRRSRRIWTVLAVLLAVMILVPILGAVLFRAAPGQGMAASVTLSEDSPYSHADVEAAFQAVQKYFKKQCRDCTLETLMYNEDETPPREDALTITARFRTGSHPKPEELKPNQTQRCTLTVSRTEDGKWTVTEWKTS
ncbi:MAG: helix-turn-helix domain-containing protein [Oscillospiraceae bacterium]|nr:helix-turn-helix domain-containing protein [Oscillospiraceae bacterium]MBQ6402403.1 helix-turn-helix domain-containing protein [Oscillospiraceae bacterium]